MSVFCNIFLENDDSCSLMLARVLEIPYNAMGTTTNSNFVSKASNMSMPTESNITDGVTGKLSIASVGLPLSQLPLTTAIPCKMIVPPNVNGVQAPAVLKVVDEDELRWCSIRTSGEGGGMRNPCCFR